MCEEKEKERMRGFTKNSKTRVQMNYGHNCLITFTFNVFFISPHFITLVIIALHDDCTNSSYIFSSIFFILLTPWTLHFISLLLLWNTILLPLIKKNSLWMTSSMMPKQRTKFSSWLQWLVFTLQNQRLCSLK